MLNLPFCSLKESVWSWSEGPPRVQDRWPPRVQDRWPPRVQDRWPPRVQDRWL